MLLMLAAQSGRILAVAPVEILQKKLVIGFRLGQLKVERCKCQKNSEKILIVFSSKNVRKSSFQ